jgi:predicted DsbA family dithiol-disulfide isomerase
MKRTAPPVAPSGDAEERSYKSDRFQIGFLTTVTLYHDPLCPWCYVGWKQGKRLTEEFGIVFDWRGAELLPPGMEYTPAPPKPAEPADAPPKPKGRFDLFAEAEGVTMPSPRPKFTRTHKALLGAEFAWMEGGPEKFAAFNDAVYAGYWEKGEDIGDLDVLAGYAERAGLDPAAFRAAVEGERYADHVVPFDDDAYATGIRHVPTFIFNGEERLAEAPYADLANAVQRFLIRRERFLPKTES